jgi:hypothetical protein
MSWLQSTPPNILSDDVVKGLVVGSLALLGSLATLLVTWLRDRDAIAIRSKRIEDATKRVAFWDGWLRAIEPLTPDSEKLLQKEHVYRQLLAASAQIEDLFATTDRLRARVKAYREFEKYRNNLPWFRRWFLLYKPPTVRAWIGRIILYAYTLFVPFYLPYQGLLVERRGVEEQASHRADAEHLNAEESKRLKTQMVKRTEHEYLSNLWLAEIVLIIMMIPLRQNCVNLERPKAS